jgi:hypothetical protein
MPVLYRGSTVPKGKVFGSHILQLRSAVTVRTAPGNAGIGYVVYNAQFYSTVTPHPDRLSFTKPPTPTIL